MQPNETRKVNTRAWRIENQHFVMYEHLIPRISASYLFSSFGDYSQQYEDEHWRKMKLLLDTKKQKWLTPLR